jgi:predicted GNAT family N-acyltransferase
MQPDGGTTESRTRLARPSPGQTRAVELRLIEVGTKDYEAELDLRRRILRWPLGLDFTEEQIAEEATDIHLGAFEEGHLVATLVLTPYGCNVIKMRQVAVEPEKQGSGIGRKLVEYSERVAIERGFTDMVLSARDTAVPFYLRLNYAIEGEPFEEVTIPHRRMVKRLETSNG